MDSFDESWADLGLEQDPAPKRDDDVRAVQMRSSFVDDPPTLERKTSDERDTVPPPVPVSEYVQSMMEAPDEPEPSPLPLSSSFTWRHTAPSSSRGGSFPSPPRRPDFSPSSERATVPSMRALAPPPPPPAPPDEDDDVSGAFNLMAFEPEPLGAAPAGFEAPRSVRELRLAPDFEELSFGDVMSTLERAASASRSPTPVPVSSPSRVNQPASIPPILDIAWATATAQHGRDFALEDEAPRTSRGLAAPSMPAPFESPRFGELDDAIAPRSSRRAPPVRLEPLVEIHELYESGDFRSALVMAEALLEATPGHAEARSYVTRCRETLLKKYLGRLGGSRKILRVAMPPDEIRWLSLDHKAGFLLACVDGTSTIEEVLDVSCMQEFEAIRILHDFRELGVVEILPDHRSSRR
jgi:hypothetical protein